MKPTQEQIAAAENIVSEVVGATDHDGMLEGAKLDETNRAVALTLATREAAARAEERERCINVIPGGDICSPQAIADAIRALPAQEDAK